MSQRFGGAPPPPPPPPATGGRSATRAGRADARTPQAPAAHGFRPVVANGAGSPALNAAPRNTASPRALPLHKATPQPLPLPPARNAQAHLRTRSGPVVPSANGRPGTAAGGASARSSIASVKSESAVSAASALLNLSQKAAQTSAMKQLPGAGPAARSGGGGVAARQAAAVGGAPTNHVRPGVGGAGGRGRGRGGVPPPGPQRHIQGAATPQPGHRRPPGPATSSPHVKVSAAEQRLSTFGSNPATQTGTAAASSSAAGAAQARVFSAARPAVGRPPPAQRYATAPAPARPGGAPPRPAGAAAVAAPRAPLRGAPPPAANAPPGMAPRPAAAARMAPPSIAAQQAQAQAQQVFASRQLAQQIHAVQQAQVRAAHGMPVAGFAKPGLTPVISGTAGAASSASSSSSSAAGAQQNKPKKAEFGVCKNMTVQQRKDLLNPIASGAIDLSEKRLVPTNSSTGIDLTAEVPPVHLGAPGSALHPHQVSARRPDIIGGAAAVDRRIRSRVAAANRTKKVSPLAARVVGVAYQQFVKDFIENMDQFSQLRMDKAKDLPDDKIRITSDPKRELWEFNRPAAEERERLKEQQKALELRRRADEAALNRARRTKNDRPSDQAELDMDETALAAAGGFSLDFTSKKRKGDASQPGGRRRAGGAGGGGGPAKKRRTMAPPAPGAARRSLAPAVAVTSSSAASAPSSSSSSRRVGAPPPPASSSASSRSALSQAPGAASAASAAPASFLSSGGGPARPRTRKKFVAMARFMAQTESARPSLDRHRTRRLEIDDAIHALKGNPRTNKTYVMGRAIMRLPAAQHLRDL